ncbi:MAG: hypothetical protein E7183_03325 [Erysipelotrichaceae bacterium]|nr:hypothetical protein [Erysipelotrichaceae bacterium]
MNSKKIITLINYIFSSIAWLLTLLFFLFNLFGLFDLWHLTGYLFIFYMPISIVLSVIATIISVNNYIKLTDVKYLFWNFMSLMITTISIIFTIFVSANWFW